MKIAATPLAAALSAALASALVTVAGPASAYADAFTYQRFYEDSPVVDLRTVTASGDGVVEIYSFGGEFLGSTPVRAGANAGVRVNINRRPVGDLIAVLVVNGQVTAEQRLDVRAGYDRRD